MNSLRRAYHVRRPTTSRTATAVDDSRSTDDTPTSSIASPDSPPVTRIRSESPPFVVKQTPRRGSFMPIRADEQAFEAQNGQRERCSSETGTTCERRPRERRSFWRPLRKRSLPPTAAASTELPPAIPNSSHDAGQTIPTVEDVLANKTEEPMSLRSLLRFAKRNVMDENVLFYLEVMSFKTGGGDQLEYLTFVKRIYEIYIAPNSPREINISGDIHVATSAAVNTVLQKQPSKMSCKGVATTGDVGASRQQDCETWKICTSPAGGVGSRRSEAVECIAMVMPSVPTGDQTERGVDAEVTSSVAENFPGEESAHYAAPTGQECDTDESRVASDDSSRPLSFNRLGATMVPTLPPRPPESPVFDAPRADAARVVDQPSPVEAGTSRASPASVRTTPPLGPQKPSCTDILVAEGMEETDTSKVSMPSSRAVQQMSADSPDTGNVQSATSGLFNMKEVDDRDYTHRTGDHVRDDSWLGRPRNSTAISATWSLSDTMEIEDLGFEIGPGGGFGDRTIFDLAKYEIFHVLKTAVFPKFVSETTRDAGDGVSRSAQDSTASVPLDTTMFASGSFHHGSGTKVQPQTEKVKFLKKVFATRT